MAPPAFPRTRFFYRISDGAWLRMMDTESPVTRQNIIAIQSESYGFPVDFIEVTDMPREEVERLGGANNWGGKPPSRPYIDYNAPPRLLPPGPPPSSTDTQNRMLEAYRNLFETERALRSFVDAPLSIAFKTKQWLLLACKDGKYQASVSARKQEDQHAWLDVIDDSETRFLDFDHVRQLIHANRAVFSGLLPDVQQFERLLFDRKDIRNRIGHVNTLSEDDCEDFCRMCTRVLAVIRPHPRVP